MFGFVVHRLPNWQIAQPELDDDGECSHPYIRRHLHMGLLISLSGLSGKQSNNNTKQAMWSNTVIQRHNAG